MKARIQDREALMAVSPEALSAYACGAGWSKADSYGTDSDVYVAEGLPEVILPRTQHLGDYAHIVSQLITIFARVAETDEISLYRALAMSDWDVIRVRAMGAETDGNVAVSAGLDLVRGAHDMLLAAACSLQGNKLLYRANKEAQDYLNKVRLGQTEQGSFVVTLLSPVPSPIQQQLPLDADWVSSDDPVERQVTQRLADALAATRRAAEGVARGGDASVFYHAISRGVSANLCEALAMLIEPFSALDISLTWARTRPMATARTAIRFAQDSAPILREVAQSFREREPQLDVRLFGFVRRLKQDVQETDGTVTLQAFMNDGSVRSVTAVLNQTDYERAIQAHRSKAVVMAEGDLERNGPHWRLLNPNIKEIIPDVFTE